MVEACSNIPLLIITLSIRGQPGGDGSGAQTRCLGAHGSVAGSGTLEKVVARAAPCLPQPCWSRAVVTAMTVTEGRLLSGR